MTNKQAINWLDLAKGNAEALKMAKESLQKQLPIKPRELSPMVFACICGQLVNINQRFCDCCGQALKDWREEG